MDVLQHERAFRHVHFHLPSRRHLPVFLHDSWLHWLGHGAGGNAPPQVAITSPTNGATFIAPWTGTIQAAASDADGTLTKVDFFAGMTLLGTVDNPSANPSLTVTKLAAGSYMLTAVATDNGGASSTSAGVTISVVAPSCAR